MFRSIKNIGVEPGDSAEVRLQKFTLVIIALTCSTASPIWGGIYLFMGLYIPAIGPLIYFVTVVPAIIHFAVTKNEKLLINVQLCSIFFCPIFMQWTSGGYMMGGGVILWSFLAPLSALLFYDVKKARIWTVVFFVCILITAIFDKFFQRFGHDVGDRNMMILITMNIFGPALAIYFAMQYFVNTLTRNSRLLKDEKHKTDLLLLNILPAKIAEELKNTGRTSPMKYKSSTVIFSDFKDFTKISEQLTPEQLVEELDDCFKTFDDIIASHGLEKIKTIGDAYMCVAGIPEELENGAVSAVHSALKMAAYIREMKEQRMREGRPYWNVRIGVHTGDVVAGIVGQKKFAYDIWGDAVNTASRMETSGEAGKVNISGATYDRVKDHFDCVYRGKIPAKNKGVIDMYFVEGVITAVTRQSLPALQLQEQ